MCGYLLDQQEYAQVEEICSRAAGIDRFAEDFYYYMIYAVYKQGNQKKALEQYKSTTELFYRERLITPRTVLRNYMKSSATARQEIITDLDVIQASLDCPGTIEEQRNMGLTSANMPCLSALSSWNAAVWNAAAIPYTCACLRWGTGGGAP